MLRLILAGLLALAAPAMAQDDAGLFLFGGDAYGSGATVTVARQGVGDVFGAGERVDIAAPIAGSAHLAGRRVTTEAEVGGDLVAIGADVTVGGPVAGSVTAAGYDIGIGAAVEGNVRATGRNVNVTGPVAGSLLVSAGTLTIDGAIGGDASLDAGRIVFGPDAAVGGTLSLYGPDAGALAVPETVAPAERIERHPDARGPGPDEDAGPAAPLGIPASGWLAVAGGFVLGVVVLAVLVFIVAAVAPRRAEAVADRIGGETWRTIWIGFLTLSALLGACIVAILTVVGALAVPVILLVTMVACFLGYLFAVYVVGRAIWTRFDRVPPDTGGERALAALLGALLVSLVGLVPFVGWPLLLLLTLAGLGALAIGAFRPEFGR
jgi:hypothetical protein